VLPSRQALLSILPPNDMFVLLATSLLRRAQLSRLLSGIECAPCCRYDLLVNGGGAVSLMFQRQPFVTLRKNVMVASNSFVVVDTVTLMTAEQQRQNDARRSVGRGCNVTDIRDVLPAVVFASPQLLPTSCRSQNSVTLADQVPSTRD